MKITIVFESTDASDPQYGVMPYTIDSFFTQHPTELHPMLSTLNPWHNTADVGAYLPSYRFIPVSNLASSTYEPDVRTDVKDNELNIDIVIRENLDHGNKKVLKNELPFHKIPRNIAERGFKINYFEDDVCIYSQTFNGNVLKKAFSDYDLIRGCSHN